MNKDDKIDDSQEKQNEIEFNNNEIKTITDLVNNQIKTNDSFKQLAKTARVIANSMVVDMNELRNIARPTQQIAEQINKSTVRYLKDFKETMTPIMHEAFLDLDPIRQAISSMRPFIEYVDENKDRLQNFQNSLEVVIEQLCYKYDITEDEASELIDELMEEGKIITHEDWSIELIEDETIIDSEKSITLSSDLFEVMKLFMYILSMIYGEPIIDIEADIEIDRSINNIEYYVEGDFHYHESDSVELENEYIVTDDTKLYKSDNLDSEVETELKAGDKVNRIIYEDDNDFMMIAVINDSKQIEYNGWIKIDDITLID